MAGKNKKKRVSLSAKMTNYVVLSCFIFGIMAEAIGLSLYGNALSKQCINHAFATVNNVSSSVRHGVDSVAMAEQVMEIYNSLTDEQRMKTGTPEYNEYFSAVDTSKGGEHDVLMHIMGAYINTGEIDDLYLAMFDQERNALVYIADPQKENQFAPGEWETIEPEEVQKFMNWDGSGTLYDISNTQRYGWMCTTGINLTDTNGKTVAFILADVGIDNLVNGIHSYAIRITIALLVVMVIFALSMMKYVNKAIVKPINSIADAAVGYVSDKQSGVTSTNRFGGLDIQTNDELENLCRTMSEMEQTLSNHEEHIIKISAEKERIGTELHMATLIQQGMLPDIFPAFPDRPEFDIYATMNPAKEVGGDFYDFFLVDDDHLYMAIADVSGKGVPAALFMMASKIILANNAMMGKSPAEILRDTNSAICSNNRMEMFVTVWLGILEISTGKLTAANAGHEYPVLKKNDGGFQIIKDKHGLVIGAMDGMKYKEYELELGRGDKLFLYTDGVPEAADGQNQMFGNERMLAALNEAADQSPAQILAHVQQSVDGFVENAEQFDDLTMMCLEIR